MQAFYRGFSYFCVATAKYTMLSHALLFIYLFIYLFCLLFWHFAPWQSRLRIIIIFFLLHNVIT